MERGLVDESLQRSVSLSNSSSKADRSTRVDVRGLKLQTWIIENGTVENNSAVVYKIAEHGGETIAQYWTRQRMRALVSALAGKILQEE